MGYTIIIPTFKVDGHQGIGPYKYMSIQGESPGNLQATYPFQIIAMDHIPSLPISYKGNPGLLTFEDLFSGYVIVKIS
ncbi:reverse transcriptase [Phytophthora megakarya]|uniref:Reverse transcriptase n=1 Tax=Phytophthora megakarya TaxID=4795 RepID=A0A225WLK9_9STRA|nr:reverse transcriptase [Phytophthora megakarya]